ncbi:MAG: biotin--[acetyl-CoA-carboxylase] ligase [Fibrobacter sp.]|nr:biotin--[acetyl-CoA-carboxylase] ligase [Fibrobacter sp.]
MFSTEKDFSQWTICGLYGSNALLFENAESTHALMKSLAHSHQVEPGAIIVANSQTKGRGRHERTWVSPKNKNIYFNLLIPLQGIAQQNYAQLTQVAALTFAEVFRSLEPNGTPHPNTKKITVKWPNDILYETSKFCGILAEILFIPSHSSPIPTLNMGIGINVNSDASEYESLGRKVTTLKEIVGTPINREMLLNTLVSSFERALGQFKAFGISPWIEAWRKMDKFIGTRATVIVNNNCTDTALANPLASQKKSGQIIDMQQDGSLLFRTNDGDTITVYSADLEI